MQINSIFANQNGKKGARPSYQSYSYQILHATMTETSVHAFETWLKLTFRLIVGDHWKDISERIVDGDITYRWCREIIRNSLFNLEHSANHLLSTAVISIKEEIWQLRYPEFTESENLMSAISIWENTFAMTYDLTRNLCTILDKLCSLKLALVAGSFGCEEGAILSLKAKIFQVFFRLKEEDDGDEASKEIRETFYIFVDFLSEFGIDSKKESLKMGERIASQRTEWKAPESWCFGDFGHREGQMEYPANVLVTDQGDFLVLEQDTQGKNTIQRLQLFNKKGRYQKTLLERGRNDVTSMIDMALDNTGNVVVTLKDGQGIGRVNAYNMKGELVLAVKVQVPNPKFPPFFTSIAVDKEGKILVVEFHEMAVHIYGGNGDFILKIGQGGRTAQRGIFENISCLSVSQNNEIYVCDPMRSVQVCKLNALNLHVQRYSNEVCSRDVVGVEV